jgi:hypothetical protein
MKWRIPWLASDNKENSTRGRFSSRRQALLVSAVRGSKRVAFPPTGIMTRIRSGE